MHVEVKEMKTCADIQQISVAISTLSFVFKVVIIALFEFSFPSVYVRIKRVLDELYHQSLSFYVQ